MAFKESNFFMVAVLLFLKRYDVLAKKFVSLDGEEKSHDKIVALLKARTRSVDETGDLIAPAAAA